MSCINKQLSSTQLLTKGKVKRNETSEEIKIQECNLKHSQNVLRLIVHIKQQCCYTRTRSWYLIQDTADQMATKN